ncbi:MAG: hypothetical protein GY817_07160 [bacterium]|nr:hypothetical protein [bacterium]
MLKLFNKFLWVTLCLFILFFNACTPTFVADKLEEQAKLAIFKETGINAEIVLKEGTLFIYVTMPGITSLFTASSDVFNNIQRVVMMATRVALSTDAEINFYHVTIAGEDNGAQIIFQQYIEDVRRYFYGYISRSDFFKRSLLEDKLVKPGLGFNPDKLIPITMPQFILSQTVYRFKLKQHEEIVELFKTKQLKKAGEEESLEALTEQMTIKDAWVRYIGNNFIDKKYLPTTNSGFYFAYVFKELSLENLVDFEYNDFYESFVSTHEEVCNIYKFKDYKVVYIDIGSKIVFEKYIIKA